LTKNLGTLLVHKMAGAAAAKGQNLEQVKAVAQSVVDNVKSFGVSLSTCKQAFAPGDNQLAEGQMEVRGNLQYNEGEKYSIRAGTDGGERKYA
jgi:dihydroxyacetone kinase